MEISKSIKPYMRVHYSDDTINASIKAMDAMESFIQYYLATYAHCHEIYEKAMDHAPSEACGKILMELDKALTSWCSLMAKTAGLYMESFVKAYNNVSEKELQELLTNFHDSAKLLMEEGERYTRRSADDVDMLMGLLR